MKRIVSILLLLLVQLFAFVSIYLGNSTEDYSTNKSNKTILTKQSTSTNFFVDAFENETEDETELDYHVLLLPITLLLNFDLVTMLTKSDSYHSKYKYCAIHKHGVFIVNRQLLI